MCNCKGGRSIPRGQAVVAAQLAQRNLALAIAQRASGSGSASSASASAAVSARRAVATTVFGRRQIPASPAPSALVVSPSIAQSPAAIAAANSRVASSYATSMQALRRAGRPTTIGTPATLQGTRVSVSQQGPRIGSSTSQPVNVSAVRPKSVVVRR